ncbi:putative oxidoreductase [Pelomonas aquatica]|uniref:Oxidoreductase n=1 Tax=Pelomonas aquatica TaxID=431058 RepID=A0ABU1ZE91_9BURK|nr:SDR family NAD(P)-dependent oxidoreductase [Pelomonas aquatica]MDR7298947.1 putative oxidoreductase [Pelomonas aquatica]
MQMQGNTILVAGGTRGIGRALAGLLCRMGNEVLVFDSEPRRAQAAARAVPGLRAVELCLEDPWSVAGFCEQLAATCPALNLLVNIDIAFPVRQLPGMGALLAGDDTHERAQARRLGIQHLTGALLSHFRRRGCGSVMNVSVGPVLGLPPARRPDAEGGARACAVSVTKRWARAAIEVTDVGVASPAGTPDAAVRAPAMSRVQWLSSVAHLLAEGLQEDAAVARLGALCPALQPATRESRREAQAATAH